MVAGIRDDGEAAVVQGEGGGGGVDVAEVGDPLLAPVAPCRVYLDDLAAGDPADGVEVVHAAVPEDAAGDRGVLSRRRGRVQGGRAYRVQPAELPGSQRVPGMYEAGVEAPRVPDLDAVRAACHQAGDLGCL